MAAKVVTKSMKQSFGKKGKGKAVKHPNKRIDTKNYRGQGR